MFVIILSSKLLEEEIIEDKGIEGFKFEGKKKFKDIFYYK